jgi:hypothetical protein
MIKIHRHLVLAGIGVILAAGNCPAQDNPNPGIVVQAPPAPLPGDPAAPVELPPGAFPFVPPRIIHYGWPALRIYRRDLPIPEPKPDPTSRETKFLHPRSARLDVLVKGPSRIYCDGEQLECIDGRFRVEPPLPLVPGVPYMHTIRVEGFDDQGREIARTVVVYLRFGRVTELTFY